MIIDTEITTDGYAWQKARINTDLVGVAMDYPYDPLAKSVNDALKDETGPICEIYVSGTGFLARGRPSDFIEQGKPLA